MESTNCQTCNTPLLPGCELVRQDRPICTACESALWLVCPDCAETILVTDSYTGLDDVVRCESCHHELYETCESCGDTFATDDMEETPDGLVCSPCFGRHYFRCTSCDRVSSTDNACSADDGNSYCHRCFENEFSCCDSCGGTVPQNDIREQNGEYLCSSCYDSGEEEDEESNSGRSNGVHDHSYKPKPVFYRADGEDLAETPYFGIELEVECLDGDIDAIVADLPDWSYAKEDGSLYRGFEVVTYPLSWAWIQEHKDSLKTLWGSLAHAGCRSHDTSTCGMHVHLSKSQFGTLHLYKFLRLIYENRAMVLTVSQRKSENLKQWAGVDNDGEESLVKKAKDKTQYRRYSAINLQNAKTVEVRIFRGTLRPESFFKNLEFCHAAIAYTLDASLADVSADGLYAYVTEHKKEYPNLHAFLVRKELICA